MTWWLWMLAGWFAIEAARAFARGFRRAWVEEAERRALDGDTVVGDVVDMELWRMADETRRKGGST